VGRETREPDVTEGASARCYPADDFEFAADVHAALSETVDEVALHQRLIAKYPHVRVVLRDSLGGFGVQPDVVYCYRDGRLVAA
jgi:hypothetical protein